MRTGARLTANNLLQLTSSGSLHEGEFIPPEIAERGFTKVIDTLASPGSRAHWSRHRDGSVEDFQTKVDTALCALESLPFKTVTAAQQGAAADSA